MTKLRILLGKFKEVFLSVLPITIIVVILNFTITPLDSYQIIRFLIGSASIIIGMSIFLFGVELAINPLGSMLGSTLTKSNKAWFVGLAGLFLGFFISIAEPALHILAQQVSAVTLGQVTNWELIIAVSIGLAIMVSVGLLRTIFNVSLRTLLLVLYLIIFALALFCKPQFLVIAFDSSGATTGAMAVPFLLSLSYGIASMKKKGKSSSNDSFGLVAIASAGAIMGVLVLNYFKVIDKFGDIPTSSTDKTHIFGPFIQALPEQTMNVVISILPLLATFIIFQIFFFKLPAKGVRKFLKGMVYTFIGLILFLVGVNAGFMEIGVEVGYLLTKIGKDWLVVVIGFVLGLVIILAEPAVYVLTRQIEDVTSGSVKRPAVIVSLCIGVGLSVALTMIRVIIPSLELWHYLLPGYIIALGLMYLVPELFVGMAFDSGGVASGPMIGTFIFAFVQGVAEAKGADLLTDGFGMIAMVALTPLISIQILGLMYKVKSKKGGLKDGKSSL